MRTAALLAFALAAAGASAATAQTMDGPVDSPFHVGAQASTLGLGLEAGYRVNPMFGLRLGGNMFTFSTDRGISGVDYNLDVKLRSFGAVLDLYPVAGTGFRISGGARINYNKADLTGTLSGPRSFGGVVVTPQQAGQLDGEAKFDRFAPYAGIGYNGTVFSPNFSVGVDLGVLFQGKPRVSLSAPGVATTPAIAAVLEDQRREVEDSIRAARFWPVVAITASYRF